ncbi:MAG: YybH family protein [Bryobacteraceae bacterium]
MRRILIVFLAAIPLFSQKPADETGVRDLVARYVDAREHRDAKALGALFTPEADQLVSSGEWRKGRPAVVSGALASSESTGGRRTITVESVRFLSGDVAIADGSYEISGLAGGRTRHMWTSIICVRTPGGWRIAAIRNMLPAAPAPAAHK